MEIRAQMETQNKPKKLRFEKITSAVAESFLAKHMNVIIFHIELKFKILGTRHREHSSFSQNDA